MSKDVQNNVRPKFIFKSKIDPKYNCKNRVKDKRKRSSNVNSIQGQNTYYIETYESIIFNFNILKFKKISIVELQNLSD